MLKKVFWSKKQFGIVRMKKLVDTRRMKNNASLA
jgi:hypothetical protein